MNTPAKKSAAELFASRTRQVVPPRTDDITVTESLYTDEPSLAEPAAASASESQQIQTSDGGLKAL